MYRLLGLPLALVPDLSLQFEDSFPTYFSTTQRPTLRQYVNE